MPDISRALLVLATFSPLAIFILHVAAYRFLHVQDFTKSSQLFLIKLVAYCNIPVLAWTIFLGRAEGRSTVETVWMIAFTFVVFNGFGYTYFHVFNLSETARRLRMMIAIQEGCPNLQAMQEGYSSKDMVQVRLARLQSMGQIEKGPDGRYRLREGFFLYVARLIRVWRHASGLDRI